MDDGGQGRGFHDNRHSIIYCGHYCFVGRIDIWAKPQMTITGDFAQVNGLKMAIKLNTLV